MFLYFLIFFLYLFLISIANIGIFFELQNFSKEYLQKIYKFALMKIEEIDLSLTEGICPVPIGVSLAYIVVVDYRNLFPKIAVNLQSVCNDGEQITLLP